MKKNKEIDRIYLKVGEYDLWVSSKGHLRAEKVNSPEFGEFFYIDILQKGSVCYKAKINKSEKLSENILNLYASRKVWQITINNKGSNSKLTIELPDSILGTVVISGYVPTKQAAIIYKWLDHLSRTPQAAPLSSNVRGIRINYGNGSRSYWYRNI